MSNVTNSALRKLRDTDLAFINYVEDIRGYTVIDSDGRPVGQVDRLFVDEQERKVRFFRAKPEPEFETRDGIVLVPVDAISRIRRGVVHIDRPREQLAIAPRDLPLLALESDVEMLYRYYGFQPFWAADYTYPPYPFYT